VRNTGDLILRGEIRTAEEAEAEAAAAMAMASSDGRRRRKLAYKVRSSSKGSSSSSSSHGSVFAYTIFSCVDDVEHHRHRRNPFDPKYIQAALSSFEEVRRI
jgi:hypothetical protein